MEEILDFVLDIHANAECYSTSDVLIEMLEYDLPRSLEKAVKKKLLDDYNICCKEEIELIHINGERSEYQGFSESEPRTIGICNNCGKIYD